MKNASIPAQIDWELQWQTHGQWLKTVLLARLPNADFVDEVFQEMALVVARNPQAWPSPDKLAPWLYRVAIRQVLMFRRGRWRNERLLERGHRQEELADLDAKSVRPVDWLITHENSGQIANALEQLNSRDREILMLKHAECWTYQQIAKQLGMSLDKVIYRLKRARKNMKSILAVIDRHWIKE